MAGTAKVNGAPLRLKRTEHVEELLQAIWLFRPELDRKNTMTLTLGLKAFLEDCQVKALNPRSTSATRHPINGGSIAIEDVQSGVVPTEADAGEAMVAKVPSAPVSDDIEW